MSRPRSLWPREHGAYVQLLVPLVAALASRIPTAGAMLLAVAAGAAFLANEPLLVVLGHRGPRMKTRDGARARTRLVLLVAIAIACGGGGLALAGRATLAVAPLVAIPCAVMLLLAWRRAEHTLAGELIAAVAVSGLAAPVAVASGVPATIALAIWGAWSVGFACSVIAVHRVIARHRRAAEAVDLVAAIGLAGLVTALALAPPVWWTALPLAAIALGVVVRPPPATRLRTLGVVVTIVAAAAGLWVAVQIV